MTTTIRSQREAIDQRSRTAHSELIRIDAEYRALQAVCPHEAAQRTSHMGETCDRHCYDCSACGV